MRRIGAFIVAIAILGACKSGKGIKLGERHDPVGDDATYSLHVADQTSNGKAVRVPEVHLDAKGYVAILEDAGGAPGKVLGASELLDAGEHDVRIKLEEPLEKTADVWAMVHLEDNNNTTYDFPNGDAPAKVDSAVVTAKLRVERR